MSGQPGHASKPIYRQNVDIARAFDATNLGACYISLFGCIWTYLIRTGYRVLFNASLYTYVCKNERLASRERERWKERERDRDIERPGRRERGDQAL